MLPKQQHYVPRFILKNFTHGKKQHIWAFDKSTDKSFRTNVHNVASEKGFYNLEEGELLVSLEPALADLEKNASDVLGEIVRSRSLQLIRPDSRELLSFFLAVQFMRTKERRLMFESINDGLKDKLATMGASDKDLERLLGTEDTLKKSSLKFVANAHEFVPHFLEKTWMLFEAPSFVPFYTSDNPMTLQNQTSRGFYGNLGLAVLGIEIYFPLTTRLSLALVCPSIGNELLRAENRITELDKISPGLTEAILESRAEVLEISSKVASGTPLRLKRQNVTNLNSLQVLQSSRFVYCEEDSFDLVRQMIRDNPNCRQGMRPSFA